jgi:hypothetical protein
MRDLRNWASALATAALILLAPIIGFAVVVTAEMLTDLLAKLGPPVVWPVAAAALGWVLLRRFGGAVSCTEVEVGWGLTGSCIAAEEVRRGRYMRRSTYRKMPPPPQCRSSRKPRTHQRRVIQTRSL